MKYRVDELSGALLDYAVAEIEDLYISTSEGRCCAGKHPRIMPFYEPSTNWADGGPIVGRERINLDWKTAHHANKCLATKHGVGAYGDTPLIAAMRCFVALHYGEFVELDVPEGV